MSAGVSAGVSVGAFMAGAGSSFDPSRVRTDAPLRDLILESQSTGVVTGSLAG